MGLLLAVIVHSATIQDRDGARHLLTYIADWLPRLRVVVADGGYAGELVGWVQRTFGWLGRDRRLAKDYEYLTQTSEAMIRVAMIHVMVRCLARLTSF